MATGTPERGHQDGPDAGPGSTANRVRDHDPVPPNVAQLHRRSRSTGGGANALDVAQVPHRPARARDGTGRYSGPSGRAYRPVDERRSLRPRVSPPVASARARGRQGVALGALSGGDARPADSRGAYRLTVAGAARA